MTDTLIFASPLMRRQSPEPEAKPWKILVVDDEPDIHAITKIALSDFKLDNRGLSQLHAYSAKEARNILEENPDIAILLLDVVMESDGAGLDLVRYIRNVLGNKTMRIVLRTGNPGHAPERRVIAEFDINDYREKSELTTQKLNTVMYTALRSYRDILATEGEKKQLEKLVDTTVNLFTHRTPQELASSAIEQIRALLHGCDADGESEANTFLALIGTNERVDLLCASGRFKSLDVSTLVADLDSVMADDIRNALEQEDVYQMEDRLVGHAPCTGNAQYLVYIDGVKAVSDSDKRLLKILLRNIAVAVQTLERANEPVSAEIIRIH